jgi:TrmH family RNA methyltransferase
LESGIGGKKSAILIGNEGSGLGSDELAYCATVLSIPLRKPVESLNSAIAASVILYESFKQRGMK